MNLFGNDYTEEEQRGIDKYLWRRFVFGMIGVGLMLLLSLVCYSCNSVSTACVRADYSGTWIMEEDYGDGYHSEDRFIELRYEKNRRGNEELHLYIDGSRKGEIIRKEGRLAVETTERFYSMNIKRDVTFWITEKKGVLTLEYKEYSLVESTNTISSVIGGQFDVTYSIPEITETDVTETYIRISKETGLTEEQRAELY